MLIIRSMGLMVLPPPITVSIGMLAMVVVTVTITLLMVIVGVLLYYVNIDCNGSLG